ncbi:hypothetical protein GCM10009570_24800 [Dietzia natronolimnaea]
MTLTPGHWIKTVQHNENHSTTYLLELHDDRTATERFLIQKGTARWPAWWCLSYARKAPGLLFGVPAGDCTYVSFALLSDSGPSFGHEICMDETDIETVRRQFESTLHRTTGHESQVAFARLAY